MPLVVNFLIYYILGNFIFKPKLLAYYTTKKLFNSALLSIRALIFAIILYLIRTGQSTSY